MFDKRLTIAILLATFVLGCARTSVRVVVPHGYVGAVHLVCGTESNANVAGTVSATGAGELKTCPEASWRVSVNVQTDDGKTIPTQHLHWNSTGDNIPRALDFEVQK
jgi:hypothetical protein